MPEPISARRNQFAVGVIGGSSVVIDYGPMRLVSDPAFDPPRNYGAYRKVAPPALTADQLGPVDVVLLSHDLHYDNFDEAGRVFAAAAPTLVTGPRSAGRLGGNAHGVAAFESTVLTDGAVDVTVFAVPAQHGPADGERDADGNINCEVSGFILQSAGLPTVYLSGDNASIVPVLEIARRFPEIDVAVLHVGAARVPAKFRGRPLTLTADRASDVAQVLGVRRVVAAHCEGWSLYSQSAADVRKSFDDAGIGDLLAQAPLGWWALQQ